MKVIIFGATGSLGRILVAQALAQGHAVSAFARNAAKLNIEHPQLTKVSGDVTDAAAVSIATQGHDAAMIVIGAGRKGGLRTIGTRHVIAAMKQHGVARLVCLSSLGVGDSHPLLNFFWRHIMFGLLLRDAMADHVTQEALVTQAGDEIDWVIVRPAAFTDGKITRQYHSGNLTPDDKLTLKISRADVADFLLRQLCDNRYQRQTPGISY